MLTRINARLSLIALLAAGAGSDRDDRHRRLDGLRPLHPERDADLGRADLAVPDAAGSSCSAAPSACASSTIWASMSGCITCAAAAPRPCLIIANEVLVTLFAFAMVWYGIGARRQGLERPPADDRHLQGLGLCPDHRRRHA